MKRMKSSRVAWLFILAMGVGLAAEESLPVFQLKPAFPKLRFDRPVCLTQAGDGSERLFLVEQAGKIHVFQDGRDTPQTAMFLDLRSKTGIFSEEEGLLCMAFHPRFKENGRFYVYYCVEEPRHTVLSEFRVSKTDPNRAVLASERVLLEISQPYSNHKGSTVVFGPDGYLYMSLGDGGDGGDPHGNGQNLRALLGKILRIDVDRPSANLPYGIPQDNPFVGHAEGVRGEIWAYGLRNVWRMSFDRKTGELWAGDVGQDRWEEIDVIQKGGNYGWNIREGKHPFKGHAPRDVELIDPILDYGHRDGMSVTGGYVYRGRKFPQLEGVYVYADYVLGTIWGLLYEKGKITRRGVLAHQPRNISSFAERPDGELLVLAFDGRIYELEAAGR